MSLTTKHMFTTVSVCLTTLAGVHVMARAGSLTPPGAPAPTMKTIEEAEPRVFITQADIPYVISKPGSYYLASDIEAQAFGGPAILVDADHVTIDMRGFAIRNGASVAFQHGIAGGRAANNVVVRNGTVRGSTSDGVSLPNVEGVELRNLRLLNNGGDGANLGDGVIVVECFSAENFFNGMTAGANGLISASIFRDNGGAGLDILRTGSVDRCIAEGNGGRGLDIGSDSTISDSSARDNGDIGVFVGDNSAATNCAARNNGAIAGVFLASGASARGCTARGNQGAGFDASSTGGSLSDCVAVDNRGPGIITGGYATLRSCKSSSNDGIGIALGQGTVAEGCVAAFNGSHGISGSGDNVITGCAANGNGQAESADGVHMFSPGGVISECSANDNSDDGFEVNADAQLLNCVANSNGDDGFHWVLNSRIIGNTATANGDDGFYGPGQGPSADQSVIMDNFAARNTGDGYDIGFGFNVIGRNMAAGSNGFNFNGFTQYSGEIQAGVPPANPLSDDPFVNVD